MQNNKIQERKKTEKKNIWSQDVKFEVCVKRLLMGFNGKMVILFENKSGGNFTIDFLNGSSAFDGRSLNKNKNQEKIN